NREAWNWTLDTAPLAATTTLSTTSAATPEAPPEQLSPPPLPRERPEVVLSDEPYKAAENLLVPNFHVPWAQPELLIFPGMGGGSSIALWGIAAGLSLSGSDRLGLHNYALNASYDSLIQGPSVSFGYGTTVAAPWWLSATASYSSERAPLVI